MTVIVKENRTNIEREFTNVVSLCTQRLRTEFYVLRLQDGSEVAFEKSKVAIDRRGDYGDYGKSVSRR